MDLTLHWKDATFVAIDLETSGQYPIESEICEVGAVKWRAGKVIDTLSVLVKPSVPMCEKVIQIHHITNEMVARAPNIDEVLPTINEFIKESYLIAHHAPFDIGFLAYEYEKRNMNFPLWPAFCTSLLSRSLITGTPNHKLQTLIKHFGIDGGMAHRALDDARACLEVAFKCFQVLGDVDLETIFQAQNRKIYWSHYSLLSLRQSLTWGALLEGSLRKVPIKIMYRGGSQPGKPRIVYPRGVVRNPTGDFLVASDDPGGQTKRFYLHKIMESEVFDI